MIARAGRQKFENNCSATGRLEPLHNIALDLTFGGVPPNAAQGNVVQSRPHRSPTDQSGCDRSSTSP